MTDARDNSQAVRLRILRRRILLGSLAVLALFFSFWRAWELESRLFFELLLGSVIMVFVLAIVGAGVAWIIGWVRSRSND
ncbi:MAG: hypothetical protein JJT88_12160 [Gammaproteobacteria bacterium]|nr:hypothetical protein [Gammaproteobacteria bacterium]